MTKYRPLLHFSPPVGWMNDPNGLVFHRGLWHLFYQYFPDGLQHGPMHWGHATSPDLLSWQHWPIALSPDALGNVWSGSAINDGNAMLLCFTHQNAERQSQSLARSSDGGHTFVLDAGNPILHSERGDFRDPKLFRWRDEWRMIVAAGKDAQIFGSSDLYDWRLLSEFPAPHRDWLWECPDLFEIDGRWVLIGSFIIPGRPHETYSWIGAFDGARFSSSTAPSRLSFGPDDYAAVSWNDAPDNRRILIGWMSRWDYSASTPTQDEGFRGAMTLPREVSLRDDTLVQNPPRELNGYRRAFAAFAGVENAHQLPIAARAFEIEARVDLGAAREVGFALHGGENCVVKIGYDAERAELFIDRTNARTHAFHDAFAGRFATPLKIENRLQLRIVVDNGSVEVFADDGAIYGAALIFPDAPIHEIELYGNGARLESGEVFTLESGAVR